MMTYQMAKIELQTPPHAVSLKVLALEAGVVITLASVLAWLV